MSDAASTRPEPPTSAGSSLSSTGTDKPMLALRSPPKPKTTGPPLTAPLLHGTLTTTTSVAHAARGDAGTDHPQNQGQLRAVGQPHPGILQPPMNNESDTAAIPARAADAGVIGDGRAPGAAVASSSVLSPTSAGPRAVSPTTEGQRVPAARPTKRPRTPVGRAAGAAEDSGRVATHPTSSGPAMGTPQSIMPAPTSLPGGQTTRQLQAPQQHLGHSQRVALAPPHMSAPAPQGPTAVSQVGLPPQQVQVTMPAMAPPLPGTSQSSVRIGVQHQPAVHTTGLIYGLPAPPQLPTPLPTPAAHNQPSAAPPQRQGAARRGKTQQQPQRHQRDGGHQQGGAAFPLPAQQPPNAGSQSASPEMPLEMAKPAVAPSAGAPADRPPQDGNAQPLSPKTDGSTPASESTSDDAPVVSSRVVQRRLLEMRDRRQSKKAPRTRRGPDTKGSK